MSACHREPRRGAARGIILAFILLALAAGRAAAQADPSWRNLEQGKFLFSQRKFGEALLAFNTAVIDRNTRFGESERVLGTVLATKEAKRADISIRRLIDSLAKADLRTGDIAAIKAESRGYLSLELAAYEKYRISDTFQNLVDVLQAGLGLKPADYFEDSLPELKGLIERARFFPEAEYWIAKVYMIEGEYEIAQRQLEKALAAKASLEVPEFAYEIEYLLAKVHKTKKNFAAMEGAYKDILSHDALYAADSEKFLREAMKRTITEDGIDKFLVLYRHGADFALAAYATLGEYYCKSGRYSQAIDHLMCAADIMATKAIGGLELRDPDFRFSDFPDLLSRVGSDPELARYAAETNLQRVFYFLAVSLLGDGKMAQAKGIWSALAAEQGEWATLSRAQLKNPRVLKADPDPEF
jgi:tetratricopeptide (TPR) repeat protein